MFLPTTQKEVKDIGWSELDIIIVTGDTYIDSPFIGAAVIGKTLAVHGFRVGIIAQPDMQPDAQANTQTDTQKNIDIKRLGEPKLFWAVTGGSVDSMVANYTAAKKRRKSDDFTPGGVNNRRPDRALIAYSNLIRRYFKSTVPVVLGGIEASLRRVAHYDYWSNSVRRSILFDAKADYILYGMAEKSVLQFALRLQENQTLYSIKGLTYISRVDPTKENPAASISSVDPLNSPETSGPATMSVSAVLGVSATSATLEDSAANATVVQKEVNIKKYEYLRLPSFEECSEKSKVGKKKFAQMFEVFYKNNDPITAKGLIQKTGDRYLVQNPPQENLSTAELDSYFDIRGKWSYQRDVHPFYTSNYNESYPVKTKEIRKDNRKGNADNNSKSNSNSNGNNNENNKENNKEKYKVKALETIKFSLATHRGCYGECNFCAITVHQGKTVVSRSEASIIQEAQSFKESPDFKGNILDVGGPTANMYGFECDKKLKHGMCPDKRCVFPEVCNTLKPDHSKQRTLLDKLKSIKGIKNVFVASGIRYDLILKDQKSGEKYLNDICRSHVSGQMKIAPEHVDENILRLMGKPSINNLDRFRSMFTKISKGFKKDQYLTYYFIAAHPGCSKEEMSELRSYSTNVLRLLPEQVQIFTPTPSTYSTLMYYTETDPWSGEKVFVEKDTQRKINQKNFIVPSRDSHKRGPMKKQRIKAKANKRK